MDNKNAATGVGEAIGDMLRNDDMKRGVLDFGEKQLVFSKGRRLAHSTEPMIEPPEYPDVPTSLKDEKDSWLK